MLFGIHYHHLISELLIDQNHPLLIDVLGTDIRILCDFPKQYASLEKRPQFPKGPKVSLGQATRPRPSPELNQILSSNEIRITHSTYICNCIITVAHSYNGIAE